MSKSSAGTASIPQTPQDIKMDVSPQKKPTSASATPGSTTRSASPGSPMDTLLPPSITAPQNKDQVYYSLPSSSWRYV